MKFSPNNIQKISLILSLFPLYILSLSSFHGIRALKIFIHGFPKLSSFYFKYKLNHYTTYDSSFKHHQSSFSKTRS